MYEDEPYYDASRFNDLPSIERAHSEMERGGTLGVALSLLGPIFAKHDMCDLLGMVLLHRHYSVDDGERPIQDERITHGGREFVTRPRRTFAKRSWPSVFAFSDGMSGSVCSLEFASASFAREADSALRRNGTFLRDTHDALASAGLTSMFGLIALPDTAAPDWEWIELNYEVRVSVLTEAPRGQHDPTRLLQTSWRFLEDPRSAACKSKCFSSCSVAGAGSGHTHDHKPYHDPAGEFPDTDPACDLRRRP
jgi:hypothetical protein